MERRVYAIASIHCDGCERTIRAAIGAVDGVASVRPDARTDTAEVVYDPDVVSDADLRERFAAAGFPVVDRGDDEPPSGGDRARFTLLVVATAAVGLAGYVGYLVYPRFDLPAAEGVAVLGLAAAAGVASFFSPCSFPLLLGVLGRRVAGRDRAEPAARPAVFGGALALGAGAFLLLAGVAIAAGGGALFAQVTFTSAAGIAIRAAVGTLLVVLGLVQAGVLRSPFHVVEHAARPLLRQQARLRREHPVAGHAAFGFGYVLAGFG